MTTAPTAAGRPRLALPAWVYNHPEMTRLETERVLRPSWQIACHVSSLPASGDYVAFDLGADSVLVLRDRDGAIRAFHNVCRHRGARLVDGTGHCPGAVTCPYHGWSYRFDGSLRAIPGAETFPGLDRGAHALNEIASQAVIRLHQQGHRLQVVHLTGLADEASVRAAYAQAGVPHAVFGFLQTMEMAYRRASLAVCRSGASTCMELSAYGVPALLVPYPHAIHNHQMANARVLESAGAADGSPVHGR